MKNILRAATCAALLAAASASASVIKFETAAGVPGAPLADAAAYRSAVNSALQGASYASKNVANYDGITHSSLFGGNSNFALKSTINFGVSAADAGLWSFRAGIDFTYGGALFIDNVAYDVKSHDVWWGGSYSNPSQYFSGTALLAAGNHTLSIYGFEGCCDGGLQAQFKRAGANQFNTFSNADGLVNAVPEPASGALLLGGLGLLGLLRRRRK